tara:strand:+ start:477 stop:656 length:180 start_codon:yes stop_codon:yes gene_type:complete
MLKRSLPMKRHNLCMHPPIGTLVGLRDISHRNPGNLSLDQGWVICMTNMLARVVAMVVE